MAESYTESELLKKYYYAKRNTRKTQAVCSEGDPKIAGACAEVFKKNDTDSCVQVQPQQACLHYSTISIIHLYLDQTAFCKPTKKSYER